MQKMTYVIQFNKFENCDKLFIPNEIAISDRNVATTVADALKKSGEFVQVFISHLYYSTDKKYIDDPDYTEINSGDGNIYVNADDLYNGTGMIYSWDDID